MMRGTQGGLRMGGTDFGSARMGLNGIMNGYGELGGGTQPPQRQAPQPARRQAPAVRGPVRVGGVTIGTRNQAIPPKSVVSSSNKKGLVASGPSLTKSKLLPPPSIARQASSTVARKQITVGFKSPQVGNVPRQEPQSDNIFGLLRGNSINLGGQGSPPGLEGPKATLTPSAIETIITNLTNTLSAGDQDREGKLDAANVVAKQGLQLFNFTENSEKKEIVTDDSLNSTLNNLAKATQIYDSPSLSFNISPTNLKQGQLGDCYILGTISVMAKDPGTLKRLMEDKGDAAEMWLCDSGAWKLFNVKKLFPASNNTPIYASSKDSCIWQMVIEKAFAVMYKGYPRLELGHSSAAMRELTGCGTEYIELENAAESWFKVKTYLGQKFILTASSKVVGVSSNFITPKHCYGVLDAKEVTVQGKSARFLKLMNPIAHTQTKPLVPNTLPPISDQEYGAFWYPFSLVSKDFEVITCGQITSELLYSWITVRQEKTGTGVFMAQGVKGDKVTFSFNHKSLRHYVQQNLNDIMKTKYGVARMIVFRTSPRFEILGFGFHSLQNVRVEVSLDQDTPVYLFVDIDYDQPFLDEYTISASSSKHIVLSREKKAEKFLSEEGNKLSFIKALLYHAATGGQKMQVSKNCEVKFDEAVYNSKKDGKLNGLVRYYGQALGYIAFVYVNQTSKYTVKETLLPAELTNVKEYWPKSLKGGNFSFVLGPGQCEVILLKFGSANNCSHVSRIQNKYVLHSQ